MDYTNLKDLISHYTGLEKDALHIHAALLIYILVLLLFKRSFRSPLPWLVVLGVELANEAHDLWENWGAPLSWSLGESGKDLWNTMLWPTALLLAARYTQWPSRLAQDEVAVPRERDTTAETETAASADH